MMLTERCPVVSERAKQISFEFLDKEFRDGYVEETTTGFLSDQLMALRGSRSLIELAEFTKCSENELLKIEESEDANYTVKTLMKIASAFDVALAVRFIDYRTFLLLSTDYRRHDFRPQSFSPSQIDAFNKIDNPKITVSTKQTTTTYTEEIIESTVAYYDGS